MQGESLHGHALYLDVDGTILDLALTPDTVEVPDVVGADAAAPRGQARRRGRARQRPHHRRRSIALFNPLKLPAVAVHGGEIRSAERRHAGR